MAINHSDLEKAVFSEFQDNCEIISFALAALNPSQFGQPLFIPLNIRVPTRSSAVRSDLLAQVDGHVAIAFGHGRVEPQDFDGEIDDTLRDALFNNTPVPQRVFNQCCLDEDFSQQEFGELVTIINTKMQPFPTVYEQSVTLSSVISNPLALFAALYPSRGPRLLSETSMIYRTAFNIMSRQLTSLDSLAQATGRQEAVSQFLKYQLLKDVPRWSQLFLAVRARGAQINREVVYLGYPLQTYFHRTDALARIYKQAADILQSALSHAKVPSWGIDSFLRQQHVLTVVRPWVDGAACYGNWPLFIVNRDSERAAVQQGNSLGYCWLNQQEMQKRVQAAEAKRSRKQALYSHQHQQQQQQQQLPFTPQTFHGSPPQPHQAQTLYGPPPQQETFHESPLLQQVPSQPQATAVNDQVSESSISGGENSKQRKQRHQAQGKSIVTKEQVESLLKQDKESEQAKESELAKESD